MRGALLLCLLAGPAHADRRLFAHAFQYGTEAPGETSVMLWHTEARAEWNGSTTAMTHLVQIQHGITDHWDAAIYTGFAQTASGDASLAQPLSFAALRLQNRYRFADRSEWPVDVQLQLDTGKRFGPNIYDLELRLVLARDIDKLALAANVAGVATVGHDTDRALEVAWSAGAGYELDLAVTLGVEAFGRIDAKQAAVGPTLALAPSRGLWLAVSAAAGITEQSDELIVRGLLGIEL